MSIQASWNTALGTMGVLGHLAEQGKMEAYRGSTEILNRYQDSVQPIEEEALANIQANMDAIPNNEAVYEAVTASATGVEPTSPEGKQLHQVLKDEFGRMSKAEIELAQRLNTKNMPRAVRKNYEAGMAAYHEQAADRYGQMLQRVAKNRMATRPANWQAEGPNARAAAAQAAQDHATSNDGPVNRGSDVARRLEEFGLNGPRRARPDIQFDFTGGND